MTLVFLRIFFTLLCALMGFQLGDFMKLGSFAPYMGIGLGILTALFIIMLEISTKKVSLKGLSSAVFGIVFGILFAWLIIGP